MADPSDAELAKAARDAGAALAVALSRLGAAGIPVTLQFGRAGESRPFATAKIDAGELPIAVAVLMTRTVTL